jgi:arabinose-5-phosphate isomerase
MNYKSIAQEVLQIEAQTLKNAQAYIDESFAQAVELILQTQGKLVVTGVGKSGLVGAKIAATLASTGTPSFFLHPTEALHGDLGMISCGDSVLAISYSGESEELSNILPHIKRFDIPLIGMSKDINSTLGRYSDIHIGVHVEKEACPLGAAPTSSTTLTMALGDALAVSLMKARDFKKDDFASFHPGGSLGRKLFVKVKDLMQTKNLPIILQDTPMKDAIVVMSEGRLGTVVLVDNEEKLVGLLSDGDVRRALLKEDFDINHKAYEYATKNPLSIDDDEILASDALVLIEEKKIQLLVITDKEKKVKGLLHLHTLIEKGIS